MAYDLTGQKFGRWLALHYEKRGTRTGWVCLCSCGTEGFVLTSNLRAGKSTSCGCKRKESLSKLFDDPEWVKKNRAAINKANGWTGITTGKHRKLYYVIRSAIRRCHNPGDSQYKYYGARGIQVCQEWQDSPKAFIDYVLKELGECPEGHSLDRIDNNGNYEPGNIRWATQSRQLLNTRDRKNLSGFRGVGFCKNTKKWRAILTIDGKTYDLGRHETPEEASEVYQRKRQELMG